MCLGLLGAGLEYSCVSLADLCSSLTACAWGSKKYAVKYSVRYCCKLGSATVTPSTSLSLTRKALLKNQKQING